MRWTVIVLVVLLSTSVSWGQSTAQAFVIDTSRPFAFIEFDHLGTRKPLSPSETEQGLWLKFVNNCRVSIRVDAFNPGTGDPGVAIFDEIVSVKPYEGDLTSAGEIDSGVPSGVPQGYFLSNHSVIHEVVRPG